MTEPGQASGLIPALARGLALLGGVALLAAGIVTTTSVLLRWTTDQPLRGDFEIVSIAAGVGVLGFLAHGTMRRTNILVDTFTTWLPQRVQDAIDAFWTLVWAVFALWLAERMTIGAYENWRSGTRTIGLAALPYWWAIGFGALCFAITAFAALWWLPRLLRAR